MHPQHIGDYVMLLWGHLRQSIGCLLSIPPDRPPTLTLNLFLLPNPRLGLVATLGLYAFEAASRDILRMRDGRPCERVPQRSQVFFQQYRIKDRRQDTSRSPVQSPRIHKSPVWRQAFDPKAIILHSWSTRFFGASKTFRAIQMPFLQGNHPSTPFIMA